MSTSFKQQKKEWIMLLYNYKTDREFAYKGCIWSGSHKKARISSREFSYKDHSSSPYTKTP